MNILHFNSGDKNVHLTYLLTFGGGFCPFKPIFIRGQMSRRAYVRRPETKHKEQLIHPKQTDNLHKAELVFTINQRN